MKTTLNTAEEIRQAVDAGKKVFAGTPAYEVIKDKIGQYLIHYTHNKHNEHYIGLTWNDNTTLNGNEFYFID